MSVDKELSNRFANMALLCAMLVVFIHLPKPTDSSALLIWAYLSHGVAKIAVPFFFVAAGYFLAGRFDDENWYKTAVLKRVKTLLVPLVCWDVLWTMFNCVLAQSFAVTLIDVLRVLDIYPVLSPKFYVMWFVRCLFVLVLFAPCLRRMSTVWGILSLWLLNGLIFPDYGVLRNWFTYTLSEGLLSVFGATWFCVGIFLRSHERFLYPTRKVTWIAISVGVALLIFRGVPYSSYCARLLTWLFIPFVMYGAWSICPKYKTIPLVRASSFPIFVLHPFVIEIFYKFWQGESWASYCLIGMIIIFTCIIIATVMRMALPQCSDMLFGGR